MMPNKKKFINSLQFRIKEYEKGYRVEYLDGKKWVNLIHAFGLPSTPWNFSSLGHAKTGLHDWVKERTQIEVINPHTSPHTDLQEKYYQEEVKHDK